MHKVQIETASVQGKEIPALVVRESRLKMFLLLLGGLAFVALALFMLLQELGGGTPESDPQSRVMTIAVGVMVVLFGLVGSVVALMRMFSSKGVLVLTPLGVEFPYLASREFIFWDAIQQVGVWSAPGGDVIGFVLTDSVKDGSVRRWVREANRDIAGFDLSVSIGKQAKPLCKLIGFYMNHPSVRNELGTPACLERYQKYLSTRQ